MNAALSFHALDTDWFVLLQALQLAAAQTVISTLRRKVDRQALNVDFVRETLFDLDDNDDVSQQDFVGKLRQRFEGTRGLRFRCELRLGYYTSIHRSTNPIFKIKTTGGCHYTCHTSAPLCIIMCNLVCWRSSRRRVTRKLPRGRASGIVGAPRS